ncbi:MAG: hypothetical protein Q4P20_13345, partial [Eubacteriales bacterium]|nr:hypothetical protein [Eubacteriales bacterium]
YSTIGVFFFCLLFRIQSTGNFPFRGACFHSETVDVEVGDEFLLKLLRVAAANGQAASIKEKYLPASGLPDLRQIDQIAVVATAEPNFREKLLCLGQGDGKRPLPLNHMEYTAMVPAFRIPNICQRQHRDLPSAL